MDCTDFTLLLFWIFVGLGSVCTQDYRSDLNERCTIVSDCKSIGYYCARNRTCQCRPNYIPNKYWNKCLGSIGERCKYDEHCIGGAYCKGDEKEEKCECKEFLYPSEDGQNCSSSGSPLLQHSFFLPFLFVTFCTRVYLNT